MKATRTRLFAACAVFLYCCILLMPLPGSAQVAEAPKGYVDPVSKLGMKRGDVNTFAEFWDRLEEVYLVPYEAYVEVFDSQLDRAEGKRLFPVTGAPLVIKRGEVIPEYRIDLSYGPIQYKMVNKTYQSTCTGELVMKNMQFGNTKANAILYNSGGSCLVTDSRDSGSHDYNIVLMEADDTIREYHLPEASFAAVCIIESEDP
ncbi:MAG TPA: hypothetical protein DDZ53_07040, partial [Firmicutes bacterium]|nr:hypothetical protein [Bacillota bacterium]